MFNFYIAVYEPNSTRAKRLGSEDGFYVTTNRIVQALFFKTREDANSVREELERNAPDFRFETRRA